MIQVQARDYGDLKSYDHCGVRETADSLFEQAVVHLDIVRRPSVWS